MQETRETLDQVASDLADSLQIDHESVRIDYSDGRIDISPKQARRIIAALDGRSACSSSSTCRWK